jgi:uncharacterized membrane protein (UPF0136 family)
VAGSTPGTRVVYLNEIDLNGSIPGAILNMVATQVPLAVADVRKYMSRHGAPAFLSRMGYVAIACPAAGPRTRGLIT